jgi:hypothetical protein
VTDAIFSITSAIFSIKHPDRSNALIRTRFDITTIGDRYSATHVNPNKLLFGNRAEARFSKNNLT